MDKAIQTALNEQINAELHSAYTYWAMSAHFSENDFDGFAFAAGAGVGTGAFFFSGGTSPMVGMR